jgi:peptidoglycan/LPS O-acetylase OafA/YrhL
MKPLAAPSGRPRFESLDGLRGVAAVSVMLGHALWSHPAIAEAVLISGDRGPAWVRWLTYTPCHLAWLAREAVVVFFVLSGFVLARPYLAGGATSYKRYYASRFIRLLLPCWAAIGLACLMQRFVYPVPPVPVGSWWLKAHGMPTPLADSLAYVGLLNGVPAVLPPLWSLRWELLFSAVLPAYVAVAQRCRAPLAAGVMAAACIPATMAGKVVDSDVVEFMPIFMLGVLLNNVVPAEVAGSRPTRAGLFAVASLLLLCAEWYARGLTDDVAILGVARMLSLVGAVGVVYFAIACPAMRGMLSRPGVLWIGQRSFSLYLVHFPCVVAAALLSGGQSLALTLAVGVPASLVAADVFYRLVELPSLRLAEFAKRLA